MVGKVCCSCLIVENSRINGDEGVFITHGLLAAASFQEAADHLDVRGVALLDVYTIYADLECCAQILMCTKSLGRL